MKELLLMNPVFKEMIWGGNRLATEFNYNIPSDSTGECWAISAHKAGDCTIRNGTYEGMKLSELWAKHRELFGNVEGEVFPLLTKIIDAKADLSIQVHPDDEYARVNENGSLGKTECWYVLDCDDDAKIVVGHNAKDKDELRAMIENKQWNELIQVRDIKKGDFFQITPGTVHAIKTGTLILETQQSSDITYRLYDYDRLQNGQPRELHIEKSIDVINCPHVDVKTDAESIKTAEYEVEQLIACEFYAVWKITLDGKYQMKQEKPFFLCSVIEGEGMVDQYSVKKGDHFIIPSGYGEINFTGNMQLIVSSL